MKYFEYKLIPATHTLPSGVRPVKLDENVMNDLGRQGWELVCIAGESLVFKKECFLVEKALSFNPHHP